MKGITPNLKANDPVLIDFGGPTPEMFRVLTIFPDSAADRTQVVFQEASSPVADVPVETKTPVSLITALTQSASIPPANSKRLVRTLNGQFGGNQSGSEGLQLKALSTNEASYAVSKVFAPALKETLASASANADVTPPPTIKVFAPRVKASLFGHNAPKRMRVRGGETTVIGDWPIIEPLTDDVEQDPVIVFDGLTKSFRYPGWRVGWAVGPSAMIETMARTASAIDGGPSRSERTSHPSTALDEWMSTAATAARSDQ